MKTPNLQIGIKVEQDANGYIVEFFAQPSSPKDPLNQKLIDKLKLNYLTLVGNATYEADANVTVYIEEKKDAFFLDVSIFKNSLEILGFTGYTLSKMTLMYINAALNGKGRFNISIASEKEKITIVGLNKKDDTKKYTNQITLKKLK